MKLTFILFAFFFNFFNPLFINGQEVNDSSNKQIKNSFDGKPYVNQKSEVKKIHIVKKGDTMTSISNYIQSKKI